MRRLDKKSERTLELMLVLITLALAAILHSVERSQIVVLNLFFLPIVISGFYLGRYRAGVLALLSVVSASTVILMDLSKFSFVQSPIMVALSVILWGGVLGLTAILVGSIADDRNTFAMEAHEAHVGVVEVLSRYLQSADPKLRRMAEAVHHLVEQVAVRMKLSSREVDDLRVASLLMDVENIEITARVIRKAVGEIEADNGIQGSTFHGTELVQSLGGVLSGAFPIILRQAQNWDRTTNMDCPLAARILHTVRRYSELTREDTTAGSFSPQEAIREMREDVEENHDAAVLFVLEEIVTESSETDATLVESSDELVVSASV